MARQKLDSVRKSNRPSATVLASAANGPAVHELNARSFATAIRPSDNACVPAPAHQEQHLPELVGAIADALLIMKICDLKTGFLLQPECAVEARYLRVLVQLVAQRESEHFKDFSVQAEIETEIADFAADPAHRHFDAVIPEMARLLHSGLALTLSDAYTKAIHARAESAVARRVQ